MLRDEGLALEDLARQRRGVLVREPALNRRPLVDVAVERAYLCQKQARSYRRPVRVRVRVRVRPASAAQEADWPRLAEAWPKLGAAWGSLGQLGAAWGILWRRRGLLASVPFWPKPVAFGMLLAWAPTGSSMTTHEIGHSYAAGHGAAGADDDADNGGGGEGSAMPTAAIAAVAMASSRCRADCRAW